MFVPIITSLLDTDLYKLTMMQTYLHQMPSASGIFRFKCRNSQGKNLAVLAPEVSQQLDHLCTLRFTKDELEYLSTFRYLKPDFVELLSLFQLNRAGIEVWAEGEDLCIEATGSLFLRSLFEIYVLSIVNEAYFRQFETDAVMREGENRLRIKIEEVKAMQSMEDKKFPFVIADFGTRRRFSRDWQERVVRQFKKDLPFEFRGTSNVDLARRLSLVPIGTMAHEYLQAHQASTCQLRDFQKAALENWVQEYRGDLGIALTDTIGMDAFLKDFDPYFSKLFDGIRHDSGNPYEWGDKAIAHYNKLGIDPATKSLVFSDGLTVQKAMDIYKYFKGKAKTSFGIGTSLTNDMGVEPLNIVMKLVSCNGKPVAKISDERGKGMCDDQVFLDYLCQVFDVKL